VLLADRVVLLEPDDSVGATITHVGTHEELFARAQRYRQLLVADDEIDYLATYFTI
jgi:ATP-binding cassette subfamily B protein